LSTIGEGLTEEKMAKQLREEDLHRLEEIYDELVQLLREADDLVKDTSQYDYWSAHVPGNMFAEEFGEVGKAGGDYMKEVIDRLRDEAEEGEYEEDEEYEEELDYDAEHYDDDYNDN
jgi:hypothetical protein